MGLNIYHTPIENAVISNDGEFDPSLSFVMDGRLGGFLVRRLWVRNNDKRYTYKDITVKPIDEGSDNIVGGSEFFWKVQAGDRRPLDSEWKDLAKGNTISLGTLGQDPSIVADPKPNLHSFLPFWVRIEIPKHSNTKTHTSGKLRISATTLLL
jgi:hypothetical protein